MKAEFNIVIDEQKSNKKQKIKNVNAPWKFLDDKEPRANNSYLKKTIKLKNKENNMSSKAITIALISLIASTSFAMKVNNEAVADKGITFLKTIDNQINGYLRALRRSSQVDFDALELTVFMNQTANIEKKLDILIDETRKNNRLLTMQMKSSNRLIDILSKAGQIKTSTLKKEG